MTVSTTTNKTVAQGNGSTTAFNYSFPIPNANELYVYHTTAAGAVTLLSPTQYSVTGIGQSTTSGGQQGGTVTYPLSGSPIPTGDTITIVRLMSYQQTTSLVNQSGYYPDVVEAAMDNLEMQIQQIATSSALAYQAPVQDVNPVVVLPAAALRASNVFAFDANGNPAMIGLPASVGAGNMIIEKGSGGTYGFAANVDFTPGTTTTLTLSQSYGSVGNVQVHFDTEYQAPDQYQLNGNQIVFSSAIPVGVNRVYVVGGTTLSLSIPPNGSIGDAQLQWGRILKRVVASISALAALNVSIYQEAFATDFGLGYGGGGPYSYNASLAQSNANGGTIVAAAGGVGCWVLQPGTDVSIETFGGAPNGSDCGPAINAALAAPSVTRLHALAGNYTVKTTLNFTNRTTPLVFFGDGGYYQQSSGTVLTFQTGAWMADMTGCQFAHLEHMRWVSPGGTGTSTMGILLARSISQGFAMYNTMFKMCIELPSSSGSASGSIALADNCAENCQFNQCWFVADTPYASTLANELSFASTYTTLANTTFSNTDKTFRQCVFQARNGYGCVFYGLADSTFDQCNWALFGALGSGVNAAVACNASIQGYKYCANLRFTGDFESFPSIAYLAGNTQNLVFDCTTANTTYSFIQPYTGTTHDNFFLKVNQLSGTQTNLILSVGAGVKINNAQIYMATGQTLLDGNLTLNGGHVYGGANDLSNSASLTINPSSSFRATYVNSTLTGSVAWAPGSVPGNSTVVTTVSVPGAVGGSDVRVKVPYGIPYCIASAYVSTSNVVELMLSNVNGSASASFGNATWTVEVNKVYA